VYEENNNNNNNNNSMTEAMSMVKFSSLWLKELGNNTWNNVLN